MTALRVRHKIVIPFMVVVVAATIVTAATAIALISGAIESRLSRQMDHVSEMLLLTGFALNRPVLERLKPILDADVITFTQAGEVVVSTLEGPADSGLASLVRSALPTQVTSEGKGPVMKDLTYAGRPYKVAYRALGTPPDAIVAIVVPTSDVAAATRAIAWTIAAIAAVMVILVAVVSQLIARSITAPIQRLVEVTRQLAAGDRTARAEARSGDEISTLARAFNDMAAELRTSEERLLRAERLATAGQLAAAVAHDIRNPLSSMRMQTQILRTRLQPGEANQELLAFILREMDRVERVVRGLLDLVKPAELDVRPVHVNELVEQALGIMQTQLAHRKISVERRLDPAVPIAVLDADRIVQALLNVMANAADAMPTGGTLTSVTAPTEGGAAVRIEISDDGQGVRPEIRPKVFDAFFTTKPEGTGLGLANARSIVERHGGSIELLPRDGRGTRAVITLPVAPRVG